MRRSPAELDSVRALLSSSHTGFFRDPARWDAIATTVIPALLAQKTHLRVWSAGCATGEGEEAYTLAMIFAEQTGVRRLFQRVDAQLYRACAEAKREALLAAGARRG